MGPATIHRLPDVPLAIAGWFGHAVLRAVGGSRRAIRAVFCGLLVLTAIPIFLVGSTPRPTNLTFEDSEPGLAVHGSNADLLLAFDDRPTRARIAMTVT